MLLVYRIRVVCELNTPDYHYVNVNYNFEEINMFIKFGTKINKATFKLCLVAS